MNKNTIIGISLLVCAVHYINAMEESPSKHVGFSLEPTVFLPDVEEISFTPSISEDGSGISSEEVKNIDTVQMAYCTPVDIKKLFPITMQGAPVDVEALLIQLKEKNPVQHEQIAALLSKPQRVAVRGKSADEDDDYKKVILALTQVIVDAMSEKHEQAQSQAQQDLSDAQQKTQSTAQRGKIQTGIVGLIGTILTIVTPLLTHYLSVQHGCAGGASNSTHG